MDSDSDDDYWTSCCCHSWSRWDTALVIIFVWIFAKFIILQTLGVWPARSSYAHAHRQAGTVSPTNLNI